MELYNHIQNLIDEATDVPESSILSRTIHDDEQLKAVLFGFAQGQELSEHTSKYAAILVFLKGEADITLGDDHMQATAGTFVHMTPNLPHSIVARTPTTMLLLMLKSQG